MGTINPAGKEIIKVETQLEGKTMTPMSKPTRPFLVTTLSFRVVLGMNTLNKICQLYLIASRYLMSKLSMINL